MPATLSALEGRIIVEPLAGSSEVTTASGLYVPDITTNRPLTGTVHSVGLRETGEFLPLNVGAVVLYIKGRGHEVDFQGKKLVILEMKDLLGLIVQT